MQVLLITPFYVPDLGPGAPLFTMLCEDLVRLGHQASVVTAVPHYPTGKKETSMRALTNLHSEPLYDAAWDLFIAESLAGHLSQTSRWGELKARFGWRRESPGAVIVGGHLHSY
jgi:hypothetical protein